MSDQEKIKGTLLLCDAAQQAGGKLYILGGGWSRILAAQMPAPMGFAIRVEGNLSLKQHSFEIRLKNDHDKLFKIGDNAVTIKGVFEPAEPITGALPGYVDANLGLTLSAFTLPVGNYKWELLIDDKPLATAPFAVSEK